jgi:peptide deformylase
MLEIVQNPNTTLRKKAKEVPIKDIKSPKIKAVLKKMSIALDKEEHGAALAAPQIGESLRIFIVSGKLMTKAKDVEAKILPDQIYINPVITKLSKKKKKMDEGCLSVRSKYGQVTRSLNATIEAYSESGEKFTRGAGGLLAQIFQHEVDHLNGILFIDKAENLWEDDEGEIETRAQ